MNRQYSKFLYPIINFIQNKAREILAPNDNNSEDSDPHLKKITPIDINYNNDPEQIQFVIVNELIENNIKITIPKCKFSDIDIENRNDQVFGFLHKMYNPNGFITEIPFFSIYYKSVDDFYARCPV
jgi:hypothetical protein